MKKTYLVIVVVVIMLVLALGFLFLGNNTANAPSSDNIDKTQPAEEQSEQTTDNSVGENEITYNDSGFSPSSITINEGEEVTVVNNSSRTLDFASDDHPTHNDNSEFNIGLIEPGEKEAFKPSRGKWGFHDHLNSSAAGSVTVN